MLRAVHLMLTYRCTLECDHCFVHAGPEAAGTMTLAVIRRVLEEARRVESVASVCFEGGEPLLFYATLLEGVRLARDAGFEVGVVTNAYPAISDDDADAWLRPLAAAGISRLSVSDDVFHHESSDSPAARAIRAAARVGLPCSRLTVEAPRAQEACGSQVVSGGVMFRGRAAAKLTKELPRRPLASLDRCPHEDLRSPSRVHIDPYGYVHLCQGLVVGTIAEHDLADLMRDYRAESHPVAGPLVDGGPARLARRYGIDPEDGYVDECHCCYLVRRRLIHRFPDCLAPPQVYGLEDPPYRKERASLV